MKPKAKTPVGKAHPMKAVLDQTQAISALCEQALAEEKTKGKASAKTHRKAMLAAEKLRRLVEAL